MKHSDLTEKTIKAAYTVHNVLGFGFFRKSLPERIGDRIAKDGRKRSKEETHNCLL